MPSNKRSLPQAGSTLIGGSASPQLRHDEGSKDKSATADTGRDSGWKVSSSGHGEVRTKLGRDVELLGQRAIPWSCWGHEVRVEVLAEWLNMLMMRLVAVEAIREGIGQGACAQARLWIDYWPPQPQARRAVDRYAVNDFVY